MLQTTNLQGDIDRCHRELAEIESQIRAGNPELPGLLLALTDWSRELQLLQLCVSSKATQ